jgi:spore coat polysaccharide biosynthesis protein SpsF
MSSTRFPGKVSADLIGKPMLLRQIERMGRAKSLDGIILATSTEESDDILEQWAGLVGIPVVRGSLDNVLARYVSVIEEFEPDVVVRATGDCPLISPAVIDRVVSVFQLSDADYVSNTMTPTFPDGLDVEVVKASVLQEVSKNTTDDHEREHVTLGVYRRSEKYRIVNVANDEDLSHLRWTVDTPEDFAFVKGIYESLYPKDPSFEMGAIVELLRLHPELSRTADDAPRNAALRGLDTGAMQAE